MPSELRARSAEVPVPVHLVKEDYRESSQAVSQTVRGEASVSRECVVDGQTSQHLVSADSPAREPMHGC